MSDVTPNDMPGAAEAAETAAETEVEQQDPVEEPGKGLPPEKLAELNRKLRNERKEAERKAREAEQRWQQLADQLAEVFGGGKKADEFDPKAAFDALRAELESERTARLRSDIARETGLDPEDIYGSTEEEMRASAERFLTKLQARVEEALKAQKPAGAPPASTVTADDKIGDADQITSPEQLKTMSPQEVLQAYREGRLKKLMGRS